MAGLPVDIEVWALIKGTWAFSNGDIKNCTDGGKTSPVRAVLLASALQDVPLHPLREFTGTDGPADSVTPDGSGDRSTRLAERGGSVGRMGNESEQEQGEV